MAETKSNKTTLSDKLARLDAEIAWFDSDDFKLEEAVTRYKAAAALAEEIDAELGSLKNEIEVLAKDFGK